MSILVELGDTFYPLSSVERITSPFRKPARGPGHFVRIRDQSESVGIYGSQFDQLLCRPIQLIPAQPDTFLLHSWLDGDVARVERTPVIGWALCVDSEVRPVTPQGVNAGLFNRDDAVYIEMPGGSVQADTTFADDVSFDNVEQYRLHREAVLRREAAEAASANAAQVQS